MNILDSTSPETVRTDVVKYLKWCVEVHRRGALGSKTQKARLASKTAADALESAVRCIDGALLMTLTRARPERSGE